jgi:hypothetical protein
LLLAGRIGAGTPEEAHQQQDIRRVKPTAHAAVLFACPQQHADGRGDRGVGRADHILRDRGVQRIPQAVLDPDVIG